MTGCARARGFALALATIALAARAGAQLPLKRSLPPVADPCTSVPALAAVPASDSAQAEGRRLASAGYDAELLGDLRAAREAFATATPMLPRDERLAYHLARAHESLGEREEAARAYCRALAIAPRSENARDARQRLKTLIDGGALASDGVTQSLVDRFEAAVREASARRLPQADSLFSALVQDAPTLSEAWYDRGVLRLDVGRSVDGASDLMRYLALRPNADDATQIRLAIERLQRPPRVVATKSPSTAFASGILFPGMGQFYTGRPVFGLGVIAVVAGATGWAVTSHHEQRLHHFVDPLGFPYTEPYQVRVWPNLTAGVAVAAGSALAAAIEASIHASHNPRPKRLSSIMVVPTPDGGVAFRVSLSTSAH